MQLKKDMFFKKISLSKIHKLFSTNFLINKFLVRKLIYQSFFIIVLLLNCTITHAQDTTKVEYRNFLSEDGKDFYLHQVEEGETVQTISKKFRITTTYLIFINDDLLGTAPVVGQYLKIPIKIGTNSIAKDEYLAVFSFYKVREKQSIYALSRKFGVSQEDILEYNSWLDSEVKKEQIIRIPHYKEEGKNPLKKEVKLQVPGTIEDAIDFSSCPCDKFVYRPEKKFRVAVMLPFFISKNARLEHIDHPKSLKKARFYRGSHRFFEFYEGMLMAFDSLRKQNVSVELYAFDTENNVDKIKKILQKREMDSLDLIIGPVYPTNLAVVAKFAKEKSINIISPLSQSNQVLQRNKYLFQANGSIVQKIKKTASFIKKFEKRNIIIIHNGTKKEEEQINIYKRQISKNQDSISLSNCLSAINYSLGGMKMIERALQDTLENIIIIPSKEKIFVSDIISRLNILHKRYNITVFGTYSWEKNHNLDLSYYHNLNIHYHTNTYIDYNRDAVQNFVRDYRQIFRNEPSQFSFQGFDVTWFFMNVLKQYGKYFQFCLKTYEDLGVKRGLQSNYLFKRVDKNKGFENNGVSILKYDEDFNLIFVNTNKEQIFVPRNKK